MRWSDHFALRNCAFRKTCLNSFYLNLTNQSFNPQLLINPKTPDEKVDEFMLERVKSIKIIRNSYNFTYFPYPNIEFFYRSGTVSICGFRFSTIGFAPLPTPSSF